LNLSEKIYFKIYYNFQIGIIINYISKGYFLALLKIFLIRLRFLSFNLSIYRVFKFNLLEGSFQKNFFLLFFPSLIDLCLFVLNVFHHFYLILYFFTSFLFLIIWKTIIMKIIVIYSDFKPKFKYFSWNLQFNSFFLHRLIYYYLMYFS
jgi:hypothetical protein